MYKFIIDIAGINSGSKKETLYINQENNYFLECETNGDTEIKPLTREEAIEWCTLNNIPADVVDMYTFM